MRMRTTGFGAAVDRQEYGNGGGRRCNALALALADRRVGVGVGVGVDESTCRLLMVMSYRPIRSGWLVV